MPTKNCSVLLFLFLILSLSTVVLADLTPDQEKEAKSIESMLIAPCCWRQPIDVHSSPESDRLKGEIRASLLGGKSKQAIIDAYVAEYGERILSKPAARGFNLLAYVLPVVVLAVGAGVAVLVVRRLRPPVAAAAAGVSGSTKIPEKYAAQIDKELWG